MSQSKTEQRITPSPLWKSQTLYKNLQATFVPLHDKKSSEEVISAVIALPSPRPARLVKFESSHFETQKPSCLL